MVAIAIDVQREYVVVADVGQADHSVMVGELPGHPDWFLGFRERCLSIYVTLGDLDQAVGAVRDEEVVLAILGERDHVQRLIGGTEFGHGAAHCLGAGRQAL